MKTARVVLALCAAFFAALPLALHAQAPGYSDWNAGRDLALNEKPDGGAQESANPNATVPQWSYGYRTGITNTNLTLYTAAEHLNVTGGIYAGYEGYGDTAQQYGAGVHVGTEGYTFSGLETLAPDEIFTSVDDHSTDGNNVIRWTCPANGTYSYRVAWRDLDSRGGDGAAGYVVINGVQKFKGAWPNGSGQGAVTAGSVALNAGDVFDVLLNANSTDSSYDTAGTRIVITPGSTVPAASVNLPLTTAPDNKLDLGAFLAGATLTATFTGNGDLVDSRYQTKPDGSLYAPATGGYDFANAGAAYPTQDGGDGVNHFAGGGANYDATGSGYGFATKLTTDTADPAAIRLGAVVGTFSDSPARADWFLIGNGATLTVPAGGAHLYVAVNDTFSGDNHGAYTGTLSATGGTSDHGGSEAATVTVPGKSNLWLAGAIAGATASTGQDNLTNATPFQVPNLVLTPGQTMTFSATGNVSNDPENLVTVGPDGGPYLGFTFYKHEKENGIADVVAPVNSLIGVFLDDSTPNPIIPPDGVDYSQGAGIDFTLTAPSLLKPFFIGDGKNSEGTVQKFYIPPGATRLFLGSLDPSDQENNVGSFVVKINGGANGGTNPGAALAVNAADFTYSVKNQPSTGTVVPGDVITYSLIVRNTGTAPAANVVVRASFDVNNTKFKSASNGGTVAANVVSWNVPALANGETQTLTYSVKVKNAVDTRSGLRLGAAVLSATADAPATALSTANLPSVGLTIVPLFNISTQSDGVTAVAGGPLTFTFAVVNRGTALVNDITVDVPLPDGYVPANFNTATFVDGKGQPVGAPFKLGADLGNGQFNPAVVRLFIDNLPAGASQRFAVTVNIPYNAAPGSTVSLPPVQLNGYVGDGKITYNQPGYGTKISNDPPLSPPTVTLVKLSPTASELDGLRLAALASPKQLAGKVGKQLLTAISDYTGKTPADLGALTSEQIIALINPYVTVDTDTDTNGKLLLDVPAPNAKQAAPYVTYVLFYLNTSDTGTAAGITISDSLAPGLKLDPNSVYVKGKKVLSSTVADGNGNLTFTDKNIKPGGGGVVVYHALVPAANTSTLNPGDIIQPVTASLTTASLSSQSFSTPYEDGILVTGPANAICESSQVSSNQVTADGYVIYDIYYKNTGGTKSKDFLVVSPIPAGAVYRSTYVPTASGAAVPSASFLTVGQQVRPSDQTRGEGIVEPAGANTAAGATSGLVVFHLGKVKPRSQGFVQVVYQFSPTLFTKNDVSITHQPYVDSGSFPGANGVLRRPTPRGLEEGPHPRSYFATIVGVLAQAAANKTHLYTPRAAASTPATQSAPQIPQLSMLQTAPLAVPEGGTLLYTFTVTNVGDVHSDRTTLQVKFPSGTTIVSETTQGAIISENGQPVLTSGPALSYLAPHESSTISVQLTHGARAKATLTTAYANVSGRSPNDIGYFSPVVTIGKTATTVITADQAKNANQLSLVQSAIATNAVQAQGFSAPTLLSAPNFAARAAKITPDSLQTVVAGADVISLDQGAALVAAGAGNLVAAGAGNLISQDGSGLVAAGAGNLVAAGAGNLITLTGVNGLGTLNGSDLLLPANLTKLVAAGAGNLVAAGAGNLISQDGSGLIDNVTGLAGSTLASLQNRVLVAGIGNMATQGLVGNAGGTLVGNAGGTLISQDGSGLIGNAGGALVAAGAGNLVAAGAGNLTQREQPAAGGSHPQAITSNGGIRLGSPDNSKYVHFNDAGGFVFSVNGDLKTQ